MLCQNCGQKEANVKYTQIVNGVKKEMFLCDSCSQELGISGFDFSMPIDLSSFLGEFFEPNTGVLPDFAIPKPLVCKQCGMTFEEFVNTGKFGCGNCYEIFSEQIDPILKNIQGNKRHVGRIAVGKTLQNSKEPSKVEPKKEETKQTELENLKLQMKQAIQEERYEDAAKIRDEMKKIEKKG